LRDAIFVGAITRYLVDTNLGSAIISTNPKEAIDIGETVTLSWDKEREFLIQ
jgi:putative spermidine/putrescine transport system ATP-binding protein